MSTNHARTLSASAPQPAQEPIHDGLTSQDRAQLEAMIAERADLLRRMAALARTAKAPVLTAEEIEFATSLGREAAQLRRAS